MKNTLCYAWCRECAWTHSDESDTATEFNAAHHSDKTEHRVDVNYLGDRT